MSASATIATANRASVSEQSEEQKMVKKPFGAVRFQFHIQPIMIRLLSGEQ